MAMDKSNLYPNEPEARAQARALVKAVAEDPEGLLNPVERFLYSLEARRSSPGAITRGTVLAHDAHEGRLGTNGEGKTTLADALADEEARARGIVKAIAEDPEGLLNPVERFLYSLEARRRRPGAITRGTVDAHDRMGIHSESRTPLADREVAPESRVISRLGRLGATSMAEPTEPTIDPTVTSQPEVADGDANTQVVAVFQQQPNQSPEDSTGK